MKPTKLEQLADIVTECAGHVDLKDDAPKWAKDSFRKLEGDFAGDDVRRQMIRGVLQKAYEKKALPTEEEMVSVTQAGLLHWIESDGRRVEYLCQAKAKTGTGVISFFGLLQEAQRIEYREILEGLKELE